MSSTENEILHGLSARLREERVRLGYNQEQASVLAGITRVPYTQWEKGVTSPTAAHLHRLANAGMDVHYIITGQRDMSRLAPEEAALLDNYRNAPEAGRRSIRGAAASWEEPDMREKEA